MPSRIVHMQIDIRGALLNWKDRHYRGVCTDPETGRTLSPREVKARFLDELAKGHRLLPVGAPCPGFDPVTGCPGHDAEQEKSA